MSLSSFNVVEWPPKDASFLHESAFWPFKVIQGRWFWHQSKAHMRLPISPSLWLWSYLAPNLRYGDLLAKNCLFFVPIFPTPLSFALSLPMFPLEFCGEVKREETSVMGLSYSEDPMIVAWVLLTQCSPQNVSSTATMLQDYYVVLLLTVGARTEECTSWTVWVWVESCCTDQAEFTRLQIHCIWSRGEKASTISATPRISWAATISSTRQHITGFIRQTIRCRNGHSRSTICRVVFIL